MPHPSKGNRMNPFQLVDHLGDDHGVLYHAAAELEASDARAIHADLHRIGLQTRHHDHEECD